MEIKFLNAKRITENQVTVSYLLDSIKFIVEWSNIHEATGEELEYNLRINAKSSDENTKDRVNEAIKKGEREDNSDLDLYLYIRDRFDATDCKYHV